MYTPGPATNVPTSVHAFMQNEHDVIGSVVVTIDPPCCQDLPYSVRRWQRRYRARIQKDKLPPGWFVVREVRTRRSERPGRTRTSFCVTAGARTAVVRRCGLCS